MTHLFLRLMMFFVFAQLVFWPGPSEAAGVGEFEIPQTVLLDGAQLDRLAALIATDPEAKAIADRVVAEAQPALARGPEPLAVIHYEGLVNTDPRRVETVASLNQMGDIARLLRAWQVSQDAKIADHLRALILAWTQAYEITGNDVNENKFSPLLMAYASLRESFASEDRAQVDGWVQELGSLHAARVAAVGGVSNRYGKHLRITALCAAVLDHPAWRDAAVDGARRMIAHGLRPDGSSHDLEERDSLGYHGSAVRSLIAMSLLIPRADDEPTLYDWVAPSGASIRKSVDFVLPYASGEKTREEWRNTKVELDRQRAAAGIAEYQPGRRYEPRQALPLMEAASLYDPT
ncbi:MAG: alginate lyase family protein, partial [Planctomycetota bacterium]